MLISEFETMEKEFDKWRTKHPRNFPPTMLTIVDWLEDEGAKWLPKLMENALEDRVLRDY